MPGQDVSERGHGTGVVVDAAFRIGPLSGEIAAPAVAGVIGPVIDVEAGGEFGVGLEQHLTAVELGLAVFDVVAAIVPAPGHGLGNRDPLVGITAGTVIEGA